MFHGTGPLLFDRTLLIVSRGETIVSVATRWAGARTVTVSYEGIDFVVFPALVAYS
jgi:hypothetical protein